MLLATNLWHHSFFWWVTSSSGKPSQLVFLVESIRIDLAWNINYSLSLELNLQDNLRGGFFLFLSFPWSRQVRSHSLPVPRLSEEILILSFTLGKQIHFFVGVCKSCILSVFSVFCCAASSLCLFFDSSQS